MQIEFTWDSVKAKKNLSKHGVSFETAQEIFYDPYIITQENYSIDDEQCYVAIGRTRGQHLLVVVFTDCLTSEQEHFHLINASEAEVMSRERMPVSLRKGTKIDDETRRAYERRDKSHGNDPDYGRLSPDQWATAMRRDEFFRPVKKPITIRIDADVLAWLQASGEGYQTRLNQILRERMKSEQNQKTSQAK